MSLFVKEFNNVTAPSGWTNLAGVAPLTLVARGRKTVSVRSVNKRIGFFGSGNTLVNISTAIANHGDLRGAQIDIVAGGRRGWSYDKGFDTKSQRAGWGPPPDSATDQASGET